MKRVSATSARAHLSALLDQVATNREPVLIERSGIPVAALVSTSDLAAVLDSQPTSTQPLGALALIGAWSILSDAEIDAFIDDIYAARLASGDR